MEYKTIVTPGRKKSWIGSKLGNKNMRNRFLVDFYIGYVCQKMFEGQLVAELEQVEVEASLNFLDFP